MKRPSKLSAYMAIAESMASLSHDSETKVGAILIKNSSGAVVATGFNGFVRGAPDAILPTTRPEKHRFVIHAEANLIANCARHGISMDDCTAVVTLSPCACCMRLLWQCGLTRVVCKSMYRDFQEVLKMPDLRVEVSRTTEGYHELVYRTAAGRGRQPAALPRKRK